MSLGLLLVPASPSVAARFIPLGHLGGETLSSAAFAISADGTAVVGSSTSASGGEAFLWRAEHGMRSLGDLPGRDTRSKAWGVSADGSVVVGSGSSDAAWFEGFLWDAEGGIRKLDPSPDLSSTRGVADVSADARVVTGHGTVGFRQEAFVWDPQNGTRALGDLPGGDHWSLATRISADGSTVVGQSESALGLEAFIWDAENGMRGLGDVEGSPFRSHARGVSADGRVVVGLATSAIGDRSFIWDAENGLRVLGNLLESGFSSHYANFISDDATTVLGVGSRRFRDESGRLITIREPYVWTETDGMRTLATYLETFGIDLGGWQLQFAAGASADGTRIAGFGRNPDGVQEAFLVVIPEPSSTLLLLGGLSLLSCARRPRSSAYRDAPLRLRSIRCVDELAGRRA